MRILVVDDEQLVRWFLERALRKMGHEVNTAASGKEAIEILSGDRYDVLFTDLRMPEENGTHLIKWLGDFAKKPKVVVCSAYITAEMAEEMHSRGICTLKKPFKLDELESILKSCVTAG
jgi:DNA-binding NtrC family response regulator